MPDNDAVYDQINGPSPDRIDRDGYEEWVFPSMGQSDASDIWIYDQTIENVLMNTDASGVSVRFIARDGPWEIRNIGFTDANYDAQFVSVECDSGTDNYIEHCYFPGMKEWSEVGGGGALSYANSGSGHITVREVYGEHFTDNGFYWSTPSGLTTHFEKIYLGPSNISGIRLAGDGPHEIHEYVKDDRGAPSPRGLWAYSGTGAEVSVYDSVIISDEDVGGSHGSVIAGGGSQVDLHDTVYTRSSRYESDGNNITHHGSSGNGDAGDLYIPEGIPTTALEAATGDSSGNGNSGDDPPTDPAINDPACVRSIIDQ